MTTKEIREKQQATFAANRRRFAEQTITIDGHWSIQRVDELNWGIFKDGKDQKSYHGRIISALTALPHKMLDSEAKGPLFTVIDQLKSITDRIENAFHA